MNGACKVLSIAFLNKYSYFRLNMHNLYLVVSINFGHQTPQV